VCPAGHRLVHGAGYITADAEPISFMTT